MTPAQLVDAVRAALTHAVSAGDLSVTVPPEITVDRPRSRDHGDYATSVALKLAKTAGLPPRKIAEVLAGYLSQEDGISTVDIAGRGFLNIRLDTGAAGALIGQVVAAGAGYGSSNALQGLKIHLEFVSANPIGPVHLGGARRAAVGDALGRVLSTQGATVVRELYVNDAGDRNRPNDQAAELPRMQGVEQMFDAIKATLHHFRTDFDGYFHRDLLPGGGAVGQATKRLNESGQLLRRDGEWWLTSTDYGDNRGQAAITSDGDPAYIADDLAYFLSKRSRGFDLCIYLLGADHRGYISRLQAAAAALGDDPAAVEVLACQTVSLVMGSEPVQMDKRTGTGLCLGDLIELLGIDAARYSLIRQCVETTVELNIDLWTKQSSDNPVFYVQYAHARLSALARSAQDLGIDLGTGYGAALLCTPQESELIALLAAYPGVLAAAGELRQPHRVVRYLEELAAGYYQFYDAVQVLPMGDEAPTELNVARLWLCAAARQVLANGLAVLGVSAPEQM